MSQPIIAQLKIATAAQHQRTEETMPTEALLNGTLDLVGYTQLLAAQFRIYESLENHFADSLLPYPHLVHFLQKKSTWLAEDLQQLGRSIPASILTEHSMKEVPQLIGMLYVLEGSMLGGQVILKSLRKNPQLSELTHRFYQGNAQLTGQRWREFATLCEAEVSTEELPQAIAGAVYAFDFFRENLAA